MISNMMFRYSIFVLGVVVPYIAANCYCGAKQELRCKGDVSYKKLQKETCFSSAQNIIIEPGTYVNDCPNWQNEKRPIKIMDDSLCNCFTKPQCIGCVCSGDTKTTTASTTSTLTPHSTTNHHMRYGLFSALYSLSMFLF
jgi:hypothetical protein